MPPEVINKLTLKRASNKTVVVGKSVKNIAISSRRSQNESVHKYG